MRQDLDSFATHERSALPAGAVLGTALAAACGALIGGAPFVWRDLAMIHFLAAVPLALAIATAARARIPSLATFVCGATLLALTLASILALPSIAAPSAALRAITALGLTSSLALISSALLTRAKPPARIPSRAQTASLVLLGLAVLWLLPATYTAARIRHELSHLAELLGESRFAEAHTLARALLSLDAHARLDDRRLTDLAPEIERAVRELESRVAVPLTSRATNEARLERAQHLAMLGRTTAALDLLQAGPDLAATPEACNSCGLICETTADWHAGRGWYQRAAAAWESSPDSPARLAGRLQAAKGVAYCERKLGRYAEAEAAYLHVLALSPTADSHFLLARYYEDVQQSAKARHHARRAMLLAPTRYEQAGEQLIDKLVTLHFGCLGVFGAEQSPPPASPAAGALAPR